MIKRIILTVSLLTLPLPSVALQVPQPTKGDSRVRYVIYDPANVVKIVAHYGYQTFIQFDLKEVITDIGAGDSKAYDIGVSQKKNSIFIKPKAERPYTNITVITNKRHYNLDISLVKKYEGEKYYMVKFLYPGEEESDKIIKSNVKTLLRNASSGKKKNYDYWAQGSYYLTPKEAWDDGLFTYLRFAPNMDFPAVFLENEDGTESLLNITVDDDVMILQRIARKFVLRKGNSVTCVFNQSYDPIGTPNPSKTVSPSVQRVINNGGQ